MLDNMKIGNKLFLLVGFLVVVALIVGVLGIQGISFSNAGLERVYKDNMVPSTMLAEMDDAMMDAVKHMLLASYHDPRLSESVLHERDHPISKHTSHIEKRIAELNQVWKKYQETGNRTDEEKRMIAAVNPALIKFNEEAVKPGLALITARKFKDANEHVVWKVNPAMKQLEDALTPLVELQVKEGNREFEAAQRNFDGIRIILVMSLLLGVALAATVSVWIIRSITKPIRQIAESAAQMAEGNLASAVDLNRKDEIGVLADSFRG